MAGVVLVIFCFWFGLGILFEHSLYTRIMSILLPVCFFVGFGLFAVFFPYNVIVSVLWSVFFGIVLYALFLVENVFLVAIGFKTVPLYRAAYTVGSMILLLTSFFMFDSLFSYRLSFVWNGLATMLISAIIFLYQFWAVAIELPDDGKKLRIASYVLIPAILMAELAVAFSFWPTGIFKGSVYLVSVIYVITGLVQADIRERLFKRTWLMYSWVGVAIVTAMMLITQWK